MNSVHKAGLQIAGFVTVVAVAAMFTAQGYMAARQAQAAQPGPVVADATDQPTDAPTAAPTETLPPQVIYIAPAPTPAPATPAPVVVSKPAPPQPAAQDTPPVIHIVVTAPPGEHEGPGDDD